MIQITKDLGFHLQSESTSYIVQVLPSGHLSTLYYGKRLQQRDSYTPMYQNYTLGLGSQTEFNEAHGTFSLETTALEISTYGKGDYRTPSIHIEYADGNRTSSFLYKEHRVYQGKKPIQGLPATFQHKDSVTTLEIDMVDQDSCVVVTLVYTVFYENNTIVRRSTIKNGGVEPIQLESCMSMNIDLGSTDYDILSLDGQWIRERHIHKRPVTDGAFVIESTRGVSSSRHNPFLCLMGKDTTEQVGECYGFGLVYSGNHRCSVQANSIGITRVQMGINGFDFSWHLEAGQSFETPEVLMTYSDKGLNGMSHHFHRMVNNNLIPEYWQQKERPILLNNWEATYFNFDESTLLELAQEGRDLGFELFVLDDGWFGKRDDDTTSLGDWTVDKRKLPDGLGGLSQKVRELGLEFGIWVEPEMVSVDSDLYRAHPDWAIAHPNREPSFGRQQLVLDLSRGEVVDYLIEAIGSVIEEGAVTYVKWDMNRNLSDMYSKGLSAGRQKEQSHRYVLGLYRLLETLKNRYPEVLFESCASGGNRFDLGMLYYMPQTWTSDNTDAHERTKIQYGTSLVFPTSTMCAHVSDTPSHQMLRNTPIETRFNVAAFGVLGYEFDLRKLSPQAKQVIALQIDYYKKNRKLLQFGTFYRMQSPFEHNIAKWMIVSSDKKEALVGYYQGLQNPQPGFEQLQMVGLNDTTHYHIVSREQFVDISQLGEIGLQVVPEELRGEKGLMLPIGQENLSCYGDELMYRGLPLKHQFVGTGYNEHTRHIGDFGSRMYRVTTEDKA